MLYQLYCRVNTNPPSPKHKHKIIPKICRELGNIKRKKEKIKLGSPSETLIKEKGTNMTL